MPQMIAIYIKICYNALVRIISISEENYEKRK